MPASLFAFLAVFSLATLSEPAGYVALAVLLVVAFAVNHYAVAPIKA